MSERAPATALPRGARRYKLASNYVYVLGEERQVLRDAYHSFLKLPWLAAFGAIAVAFFLFNLAFGAVYLGVGGVAGTRDTFTDALSFSVQTMATIGYGVMHPVSGPATGVMIAESMFGIVFTALTTGLVFAKFSRPTTRIRYSQSAVVTTFEGKPTLIFRVGNRRANLIVEAQLHAVVTMTTLTAEGEQFYKAHDLKLVRDRQVGMTRGWTVMHVIDETSPLYGETASSFVAREGELNIALQGTDNITMQAVTSTYSYDAKDFRFGHRFVDTLTILDGDRFLVDLRNFDSTVPDTDAR